MVHHIVLFKLKPEVTPEKLELMMMSTRMMLLKIPEVLSVKCGKKIDPECEWPFFISVDCESMDKLAIYRDDPVHLKYVEDIIKPNTTERLVLDYEMEPGKAGEILLKFSGEESDLSAANSHYGSSISARFQAMDPGAAHIPAHV